MQSTENRTILICDDDQDVLDAVSSVLREYGYDVVTAHEHTEFMACLQQCNPSVIILDIRMPERDGIWLAEGMQALGSQTPVIFLTGYDSMIYRLYAPFVGSVAYLTKPVDSQLLLAKVEKAIHNAAAV
jgi:FixJ family two-component response regulator